MNNLKKIELFRLDNDYYFNNAYALSERENRSITKHEALFDDITKKYYLIYEVEPKDILHSMKEGIKDRLNDEFSREELNLIKKDLDFYLNKNG